jgi:hypothetical protein
MNDRQLNEILQRAGVPEREPGYWERFPARTTAELKRRAQPAPAQRTADVHVRSHAAMASAWSSTSVFRTVGIRPAFALGLAAACVAFGFMLGLWKGQRSPAAGPQLAQAQKYYREIQALFPNQLQAIVFDQQGTHLVLAPEPNLPDSPPLYVKICGPAGCESFVTFSGQQIRVNGDVLDVLMDHRGDVLVVGRSLAWSSAHTAANSGPYRIEARALEVASIE